MDELTPEPLMAADCFLTQALDARALAFRTAEFALADDLGALDRLRGADAPAAVVLYCARVLEVLTREALGPLHLPQNAAQSLRNLKKYRGLPGHTHAWLHRLRELGNDARHVRRAVTPGEAD